MSEAGASTGAGRPVDAEEQARAEVYGLLAHLYIAPPPPALYEQLRAAPTAGTEASGAGSLLEGSWATLIEMARRRPLAEVTEEYVALFGGVGKPEIALNGSWFLAGALNEKPLAALRADLDALGLERPDTVYETEDHIAALCQVMQHLIAGEGPGAPTLAAQQRFFDVHLRSWIERLCEAIEQHPRADFYRAVAAFTRDFIAVEAQAFDLL